MVVAQRQIIAGRKCTTTQRFSVLFSIAATTAILSTRIPTTIAGDFCCSRPAAALTRRHARRTFFASSDAQLLRESKRLEIRGGSSSGRAGHSDTSENEDESHDDLDEETLDDAEDDLTESEEDEEDEKDDHEEEVEKVRVASSDPLKVKIQTGLNSPHKLMDQTLELTVSRSRDVASLKSSIRRQMRGRPPTDAIRLLHDGRLLTDEELVNTLVDEEEIDDDDEDKVLLLTLDMVPPVDTKFATELFDQMKDLTTNELLDCFVINAAAMHQNTMDLLSDQGDQSKEDQLMPNNSVQMRNHAMIIRDQLISTWATSGSHSDESIRLLLSSEIKDEKMQGGDMLLAERMKGGRSKKFQGGASMNVKRVLQKNLNINWPNTIRNFFLFLFFGYFGGRSFFSRTLLLLGAPTCFILQARPVKIGMKQLFYAIGKPPGILLSLLPAPQQVIMSLDYDTAMKDLYGDAATDSDEMNESDAEVEPYDMSTQEERDEKEEVDVGDNYDDEDNYSDEDNYEDEGRHV